MPAKQDAVLSHFVLREKWCRDACNERVIWPIGIAYFDAQRLVIAWCELRQDFRSFRTDRMIKATVSNEKYQEKRKVLLKRWSENRAPHGGDISYDAFA